MLQSSAKGLALQLQSTAKVLHSLIVVVKRVSAAKEVGGPLPNVTVINHCSAVSLGECFSDLNATGRGFSRDVRYIKLVISSTE